MNTIKKLLFAIIAIIPFFANAEIVKENGNYVTVRTTSTKSANIVNTGKTFTDSKGNVYPIMINKNTGSCFVIKTSQKLVRNINNICLLKYQKRFLKNSV